MRAPASAKADAVPTHEPGVNGKMESNTTPSPSFRDLIRPAVVPSPTGMAHSHCIATTGPRAAVFGGTLPWRQMFLLRQHHPRHLWQRPTCLPEPVTPENLPRRLSRSQLLAGFSLQHQLANSDRYSPWHSCVLRSDEHRGPTWFASFTRLGFNNLSNPPGNSFH